MESNGIMLEDIQQVARRNRRKAFRFPFIHDVKLRVCTDKEFDNKRKATTINIGQGGVALTTDFYVPLSAIVLIESNWETWKSCIDMEELLLTVDNFMLGKVVRALKNPDNTNIILGIELIKVKDIYREDIRQIIKFAS